MSGRRFKLLTDGEKMIWAAAFARAAAEHGYDGEISAEIACGAVESARAVMEKVREGYGPRNEVTLMLRDMLSSEVPL